MLEQTENGKVFKRVKQQVEQIGTTQGQANDSLGNVHRILTAISHNSPAEIDYDQAWKLYHEGRVRNIQKDSRMAVDKGYEAVALAVNIVRQYTENILRNNRDKLNGTYQEFENRIKVCEGMKNTDASKEYLKIIADIEGKIKTYEGHQKYLSEKKEELLKKVAMTEKIIQNFQNGKKALPELMMEELKNLLQRYPENLEETDNFMEAVNFFMIKMKRHW